MADKKTQSDNEVKRPRIAQIPKDEAEKAISEYLSKHHFLVLATSEDNIPRATTLAYASSGTTVYIFTGRTKASRSIESNNKVSLGIYTEMPYHPVQGINYRGRAEIITQENPGFAVGWKVFCNNPTLKKEEPWANMEYLEKMSKGAILLKIVPEEITLHDNSRKESPIVLWTKK